MLTQISLINPPVLGTANLEMPVLAPDENGMFIDHIDGLGPVDDTITTKAFGSGDGEYFVSRSRGKRNLVFHFGFESRGHDAAAMRQALIKSFYTQGTNAFTLRFQFDDGASVDIDGYLETEEGDRFSSDPDCTLSVICPKPNFRSTIQSTAFGQTDHDPALTDMVNLGNRDMGFAVKLIPLAGSESYFAGDVVYESKLETSPGVYDKIHTLSVNAQSADLPNPMQPGEEFWIDTRLGMKSVYIYTPSTGAVRNALRNMDSDSSWPRLYPGTNKFSIAIDYWDQGVHPMDWTAYWYDEYGSI